MHTKHTYVRLISAVESLATFSSFKAVCLFWTGGGGKKHIVAGVDPPFTLNLIPKTPVKQTPPVKFFFSNTIKSNCFAVGTQRESEVPQ